MIVSPATFPKTNATTTSSANIRRSGTSLPATSLHGPPASKSTPVTASAPLKNSVYLDFRDALARLGRKTIEERYGNLFSMYRDATSEDPYTVPMRIAPGAHFTMGGLWNDYDQMTSIPGLFVGGEAGWGYHGANRLGANSLLSACVDGWFTPPVRDSELSCATTRISTSRAFRSRCDVDAQ